MIVNLPEPEIISCCFVKHSFKNVYELDVELGEETFTIIYDPEEEYLYCEGLWEGISNLYAEIINGALNKSFKEQVKLFIVQQND